MKVEQIIKDCGGVDAIAAEAIARGKKITVWGIYKWHANGIPEKHWALVSDLSNATIEQIFAANADLRASTTTEIAE